MFDLHVDEPGYRQRLAANLRTIANDLKRNDDAAESDLGLPAGSFSRLASGEEPIPAGLLQQAVSVWPVNERDFLPLHDDCVDGVRVMRAKDSLATSRVFQRGGYDYYEYRDTVMSRVAAFRPEWIRMLVTAPTNDPDDPVVQWNEGHLLYQFTYFVGPVNYYYESGEGRRCIPMQTGDSVWGLPFVPHSFAKRDRQQDGYILALTYGAELSGDPQQEMAVLGVETTSRLALPVSSPVAVQAALLARFLEDSCMSAAQLGRATGLAQPRLHELLEGRDLARETERSRLADALGVAERELLPILPDTEGGIRVVRNDPSACCGYPSEERPSYRVRRLAGCRLHPSTRGLEITPLHDGADGVASLTTSLHQYIYNRGPAPVRLQWEFRGDPHELLIDADDSLYMQPCIPHRFTAAGSEAAPDHRPTLVVLRIAGRIGPESAFAAGCLSPEGLSRAVSEDRQWYRAAGSRAKG